MRLHRLLTRESVLLVRNLPEDRRIVACRCLAVIAHSHLLFANSQQTVFDPKNDCAWKILVMTQYLEAEMFQGSPPSLPDLPERTDIAPGLDDLLRDLYKAQRLHKNKSLYQSSF